jgi:hypothetical protein
MAHLEIRQQPPVVIECSVGRLVLHGRTSTLPRSRGRLFRVMLGAAGILLLVEMFDVPNRRLAASLHDKLALAPWLESDLRDDPIARLLWGVLQDPSA